MATAKKSCGRKLKLDDKKLTEIYGVTKTDSKFTCYCHHFTPEGKHCVVSGQGSDKVLQCHGVMYASASSAIGNFMGMSSLSLKCGDQRGTHKKCQPNNCPFCKEGKSCPYSIVEEK